MEDACVENLANISTSLKTPRGSLATKEVGAECETGARTE